MPPCVLGGGVRSGAGRAPQVILLLPAVVLALDASTRAPGEPWRKTFSALFWWVVVVSVVAGLGFLPLVASGIGGDFLACLKALVQPPYNKVGPSELLIRLSPQKHPLVLGAIHFIRLTRRSLL